MDTLRIIWDRLLGNTVVAPEIYSADIVAFNLVLSMFLGIVIAYVYKSVHKGISYSQSYVYSIVVVTMVVSLAMMVIGNDITRAFALLGTFTIIRYRTAIKDPKDTAFIFIALVVGLAVGSSNYSIAIVGTLVISIAAIVLDRTNFGAITKLEQVLYLTVDSKAINQNYLEELMHKGFKSSKLLNVNYINEGNKMTFTYNIEVYKSHKSPAIVKKLSTIRGVESVEILAAQNIVEF